MMIEGDAQMIINVIKKKEACMAWYGDLIEEAKFLLNFREWSIIFTHREGNGVAHVLAKQCLFLSQEQVWFMRFESS